MNLVTAIQNSVVAQDLHWALHNCFESWDTTLDAGVIIQGIHTRMSALGQPLDGVQLHRVGLNEVLVNTPKRSEWLRIKEYRNTFRPTFSQYSHNVDAPGRNIIVYGNVECFNESELDTMAVWLLDNFHHNNHNQE